MIANFDIREGRLDCNVHIASLGGLEGAPCERTQKTDIVILDPGGHCPLLLLRSLVQAVENRRMRLDFGCRVE